MKARKGRLRFIHRWKQPAIAYLTQELQAIIKNYVFVPAASAVIVLGPHTKMNHPGKNERIFVQVLSCVGVVWIEMCDLTNGPDPE